MQSGSETYAVLQAKPGEYDFTRVSGILMEICGMPMADATYLTRHFNGILVRDLQPHVAERLVNALAAVGVEAFALREDAFVVPPPPEEVINMDCREAGLVLQDIHGRDSATIPWPSVYLLACGRVKCRHTQKIYEADRLLTRRWHVGIYPRYIPEPVPTVRTEEKMVEHMLVDIFSREPERHLRIDARRFNYDYLGSRKAPTAAANLRTMLGDIAHSAPNLWANSGVNAVLAGERPTAYRSMFDFDEECLWLIQLIALEGQGDG